MKFFDFRPARHFARHFRKPDSAKRELLYERLEERILFDAVPDAPVETEENASLDQANAARFETSVYAEDVKALSTVASSSIEPHTNDVVIRHELVIVDSAVENYEQFVADIVGRQDPNRLIEVATIDGSRNGIEQISVILAQYQNLDSVHVVSHGDESGVQLGNVWLTRDSIAGYASDIASWTDAFTAEGDLLLFGCDLARSADGRDLLQSISTLTGTDVAASTDATGFAPRGGDWDLEYILGSFETTIAFSDSFQANYQGLLAPGPDVSLNVPAQSPLGENVNFTVTFQNTGPSGDVGYGPFIDLLIPYLGTDGSYSNGSYTQVADGLNVAATGAITYLGNAVNYQVYTFTDADGASGLSAGIISHPYAEGVLNETQLLGTTGTVSGGTFTLTFGGQTTSAIAYNASAATIQTALRALSNIGASNVNVSGTNLQSGLLEIEFAGTLAQQNVSTITFNTASLTGGGSLGVLSLIDGSAAVQARKVYGNAGDKLVVIELPFGSFTPEQPDAVLTVAATMSNLADVNQPLTIRSRGGFRYGDDAINNPLTDPSRLSDSQSRAGNWVESSSVTPTLLTLIKTNTAPESETATGPNNIRQWTINVDIPAGQTIADLDIFDDLPNNIVFVSLDSITSSDGSASFTTNLTTGNNSLGTPLNNTSYTGSNSYTDLVTSGVQNGQSLVVTANSVTGTTSASDVRITFSYYVAEFDADGNRVIPLSGEDDTTSTPDSRSHNNARAIGDWTPIDVRDAGGIDNAVADPAGIDNTLDDKSIAIQKSVTVVNALGVATGQTNVTPGSYLRYTLSFQLSDYYTYGDLVLTDILSDGQRFYGSLGPQFTVSDLGNTHSNQSFNVYVGAETTTSTPPGSANFIVDQSEIDGSDNGSENAATDGSTRIIISLSQALDLLGGEDGILQGGLSVDGTNRGAATGTITFYTQVQDEFSDTFASGDRSVDQGDILGNSITIDGTVRENEENDVNASLFETLYSESDTSAAGISVAQGTLSKTIYAINGSTSFGNPVQAAPGDRITYRLTYSLPTSDFEDLVITDFFPLPVFTVADPNGDDSAGPSWTFDADQSANLMLPGVVELLQINGSEGDTFYAIWDMADDGLANQSIAPTLSIDTAANSLRISFGTFDNTGFQASTIDLLLTVVVQDDPFADGLFLTNQAQAGEGTTNGTPASQVDLVQIQLTEPLVETIRKGIVDSSKTAAFTGTNSGNTVTFTEVGSAAGFSGGIVNSDWLTNVTLSTVVSNLDAGDTARFAVVVENIGSSRNGAFDVTIADTLGAGLTYVAGSLRIYDGTGTLLTYAGSDADLFTTGLRLDDPGATVAQGDGTNGGSLDAFDATNGRNVAILVYDVMIADTAQPTQLLQNVASLTRYAGSEGGDNHVVTPPQASAGVGIINLVPTKSVVTTSESTTTGTNVTIGEIVRYRLQVRVPEGSSPNLQLADILPSGLTFFNDNTARVAFVSTSGTVTSSTLSGAGLAVVGDETTISSITPTFVLPDSAVSTSTSSNSDTYNSGTDIFFKLGNIVNIDNDSNFEYIVIEFNALVDNTSGGTTNDAGTNCSNRFDTFVNGTNLVASNSVNVRIVEPLISNLSQVASASSGDTGDTITFTITYSAATGTNRSNAFDARVVDNLPANYALNVGSVTVTLGGGATGTTNASASNSVDVTVSELPPGGTVQITYTATLVSTVEPGTVIANTASLTYTSLPGSNGTTSNATGSSTPGTSGSTLGERNGSGGHNDYAASSNASLTVTAPQISKQLVATEIVSTGNSNTQAVVGEYVTYTVIVTIPEGQTDLATIVDTLDLGLVFVDLDPANPPVLSSGLSISGSTTPVITSAGRVLTWNLGTVTNTDTNNAVAETITLTYRTVVTNIVQNQSAQLRNNQAVFGWEQGTLSGVSATDITIREPNLTVTQVVALDTDGNGFYDNGKMGDAGDAIRYTFTLSNVSGTDAFDIDFSDTLPTLGGGSSAILSPSLLVTDSAISGAVSASDFELIGSNATGWTLRKIAGSNIDLSTTQKDVSNNDRVITFTVTGTIAGSVSPNQTIANTANTSWTSLNGDVSSSRSSFNASGVERTGSDGSGGALNDYANLTIDTFSVNSPVFTKSVFSTDRTETTGPNVTIGETITYALFVTLPEGTIPDTTLVDLLPAGLDYTGYSIITTAAGSLGYLGNQLLANDFAGSFSGLPTVSGGTGNGVDASFVFGQIDVDVDNNGANNSFLILINAIVLDVPTNRGYVGMQTALSNTATIDFSTDANLPQSSNSSNATVVEPSLRITKEFGSTVNVDYDDAGNTVTVNLSVDNLGGTSSAYDVRIQDILNSSDYVLTSVNVGIQGSQYPSDFTVAYDSATGLLTYSGGTIAAGQTVTFSFTATLTNSVLPGSTLTNTATITDSSSLNGIVTGERNDPDPDGDGSDQASDTIRIRDNSLAGFVWHDADNDGVKDVAETGIANIAVRLTGTDHLGNSIDLTINTGVNGVYLFDHLRPGTYTIQEDPNGNSFPAGYLDGRDTIGTPGGDSSINDRFASISLPTGFETFGTNNNFGELLVASLAGIVFNDHDNDGLFEPGNGETGIAGVSVRLTGIDDVGNSVDVVQMTATDGTYLFSNLRPSNPTGYTITETQPIKYSDGIDRDGSLANGLTSTNDVISSINVNSDNTGTIYTFAERGATISGLVFVDDNRSGTLNVGESTRIAGVMIELFDLSSGLPVSVGTFVTAADGAYHFDYLPTGDYQIVETQPTQYGNTSSNTINVTLTIAGSTNNYFGESLFDLGDIVYFDNNNDGLQDVSERGIGDIRVTLQYAGADGIFGNGDDPTSVTVTTAADGSYRFNELFRGNYTITLNASDIPVGMSGTAEIDDTSPVIDRVSNITVDANDRFDVDFGFAGSLNIGDTFWYDINGDGTRNPYDSDNDGSPDALEFGLGGVTVDLLFAGVDGDFATTLDNLTLSTTTAADGTYQFANLPQGQFRISYASATLPTGYVATAETDDSSIAMDGIARVSLATNRSDIDFGFVGSGTITDTVFFDRNNNATKDGSPTDRALPNVDVTLSIDFDNNGTIDYTTQTITDVNGQFTFTNLFPGTYTITTDPADMPLGLANHPTVDNNGIGTTHVATYTLPAGATVTGTGFGFHATPNYEIIKTANVNSTAPGATIQYTIVVNNLGELDGRNVVVTDNFPADILTVTDATGGAIDAINGTITFNIAAMQPGDQAVFIVTADVINPALAGRHSITNSVSVTDDGYNGVDPDLTNNSDSVTTPLIAALPDYVVTVTDNLIKTDKGEAITYVVVVRNEGNQNGTGVVLTSEIPRRLFNNVTPSGGGVYDPATGIVTWNIGNLNSGDMVVFTIDASVANPIPFGFDKTFNRAGVNDDGNNGADPTPLNNIALDTTALPIFAYDSLNDFSNGNKNLQAYEHQVFVHPGVDDFKNRLRPLPIDTVYTGIVDPGTTLSGKIYDSRGRMVGETIVMADSAGNWLMQFPSVVLFEQPHEMRIDQTMAVQNSTYDAGFNMRRFFHPAVHSQLYFSEPMNVGMAYRHNPHNVMAAMHAANNNPLAFSWTHHAYELIVSSTNSSAM